MSGNIPFIHLLRSPNSGYVFDVNKNEVIAVDNDVYWYLDKILKGQDMSSENESVKQKIQQMKEYGYLSSKRVEKIQHPQTPYLKTISDRNMAKITLQLTQDCNFRCSY